MGGRKIWYDDVLGRLNVDGRGNYVGEFETNDQILVITRDGNYELTNFDLSNHYEADQVLLLTKFKPKRAISLLYYYDRDKAYLVKRFLIETLTMNKKFLCIPEGDKNRVVMATDQEFPVIIMEKKGGKKKDQHIEETVELAAFIEVKGWKSIGNRLTGNDFVSAVLIPVEEPEEEKEELAITEQVIQPSLLANEDMIKEEEERVKKLLEDDDILMNKKKSPNKKPSSGNTEQPKLF